MSAEELVKLGRHAEDMAANDRVPPDEAELWAQIRAEISAWLGAEQEPQDGPGLFGEDTT